MAFSAQPPDLHCLSLGRQSFAALGPLALLGSASYPIPVRRLADSLAPSFSPPLTVGALGFTWIATTCSPGTPTPKSLAMLGTPRKAPQACKALRAFCYSQAGDRIRTGDPQLGKLMLYQLSYTRDGGKSKSAVPETSDA